MSRCANSGTDDLQICGRIKQLRLDRGEKQETVAKALGIERTTYTKYEVGTSKFSTDMIVRLANYYEVDCDFILRGHTSAHSNIYQETGLSEKAIAALKTMVPNQTAMLSLLIEHGSMRNLLSHQLTAYFINYGTPPITEFKKEWEDFDEIKKAAYAWACTILPADQARDHHIHQACDLFLDMMRDIVDERHGELSDKGGHKNGQHS